MTQTTTVRSLGGNQYNVDIDGDVRIIDLDGVTAVSDDDYKKLEEAGLADDNMLAPMHGEDDAHYVEAMNHVINYSGFDVDAYILENK